MPSSLMCLSFLLFDCHAGMTELCPIGTVAGFKVGALYFLTFLWPLLAFESFRVHVLIEGTPGATAGFMLSCCHLMQGTLPPLSKEEKLALQLKQVCPRPTP